MRQKSLTKEDWNQVIPKITNEELDNIVEFFIVSLDNQEAYYIEYIKQLLTHTTDEDRLTEIMETLFAHVTEQSISSNWFNDLWLDFLQQTESEILIENFFLFMSQLHHKNSFDYNSKFIKTLDKIPSIDFKTKFLKFLLECDIFKPENTEILQLFSKASTKDKLQLLLVLADLPESDRFFIGKSILFLSQPPEEEYIILAILFHMKKYLPSLFNSYMHFKDFISHLKDEKTLELLFSEYTKPDSLEQVWIQQIILDLITENSLLSNFIIESSGEFIEDWHETFRDSFLQLIMTTNDTFRTSLAKIISPLWHDEQIILQLLKMNSFPVLEALYESVSICYQDVSQKIQDTFLKLFRSDTKNQKFLGLVYSYNFEIPAFREEVEKAIQNMSDITKENYYAGILLGLGMKWNFLDTTIQTTTTQLAKKLSRKLKKDLLHGLEMFYGSLNIDGINLSIDLQSYDYQVVPDEITFEESKEGEK